LIVIFEWIDDLPGNAEEIEELLNVEVVGAIPHASRRQQLPDGELAAIPTVVEACQLLCAFLTEKKAATAFKLVMVTSALNGEGKSTVATLLASLLAKSGKSVLLADANMRKPEPDQSSQSENKHELSNAVPEENTPDSESYTQSPDIPTLYTLKAGTPSGGSDGWQQLPSSDQFLKQLQDAPFDYIIFDTPPLLPAADAQLLALHMQAILLVVDGSKTPRRALLRTGHVLERIPVAIQGAVINKNQWNYA
jgi:polysaccharide biosynthesis transport protein